MSILSIYVFFTGMKLLLLLLPLPSHIGTTLWPDNLNTPAQSMAFQIPHFCKGMGGYSD